MIAGLLAGFTWAIETIILGMALAMTPFVSTEQAVVLAPFASTFLHDAFSAIWACAYNAVRGNLPDVVAAVKTRSGKFVALAAVIGGPVGMTGYVLTVNNMGASIGAVASAIFPAIGAVLAYFFLKEEMQWYRWVFLVLSLLGVYGLSYSPDINITNFWLGFAGTLMCAFGWGIEAVIIAKCVQDDAVTDEIALQIRQTTSALVYGLVILPVMGGWPFTVSLCLVPLLLPRHHADRRVEGHGAQRQLLRLGGHHLRRRLPGHEPAEPGDHTLHRRGPRLRHPGSRRLQGAAKEGVGTRETVSLVNAVPTKAPPVHLDKARQVGFVWEW